MPLKHGKCTLESLNELVEISRKTFVDAFEKQNDPKDFKAYVDSAFSRSQLREELLNPNSEYYFVKSDEDLVGYFKINQEKAQTEFKEADSLELERIYVLKKFQGKQIGSWMIAEVIRMAVSKQKSFLWLGVWEHNKGAIDFYEKHGFKKVGTHPYYVGSDKQTDWLMRYDFD